MRKKARLIILAVITSVFIALAIGLIQAPNWIRDQLVAELERLGLRVVHMDAPTFSLQGVSFSDIRLEWHDESTTAQIHIKSLHTDIQWQEQRLTALRVEQMHIKARLSSSDKKSPWPTLSLPPLPIEHIHIQKLQTELNYNQHAFHWMGALDLLPRQDQWTLNLFNATQTLELQIQSTDHVQLQAQLNTLGATATLELEASTAIQPTDQIAYTLNLDTLLLTQLPWEWPWLAFTGQLNASGNIQAGEHAGEWLQIVANWQLNNSEIKTENLVSQHTLLGKAILTPRQILMELSSDAHAHIQLANEPLLSPIHLRFGRPLSIIMPLTDTDGEPDAANHRNLIIDGELLATLSYDGIALDLRSTLNQQSVSQNPMVLSAPLVFKGSARQWKKFDTRFSQLGFEGNAQLSLDPSAPQTLLMHLIEPMSMSWEKAQYGPYLVSSANASLNASAQLPLGNGASNALYYQAKITSNHLNIQNADTHYDLEKPVIQLASDHQGIHLNLDAKSASMNANDVTQSIQSLQVTAHAKAFAMLAKKIEVQGTQMDHPLLKEWPKPDVKLIASEKKTGVWTADGDVILRSKPMLHFSAEHQLNADLGQASVQWKWPLPELHSALSKRPKALTPLAFMSGDSQGQFQLSWHKDHGQWQLQAHGNSSASDTAIVWQESSGSGLNITASLDDLQKLNGTLSANMSAFALAAGINATALSAEIHKTDTALRLNKVYWKLLDAEWFVPDQEFLPGAELHAPMAIIGLNLGKLLKLFDVHGLTGQGVLDGAIPITLKETGVVMEDAELHAREPGRLSYAPGAADPNENIGLKVLRNFHYKTLRVQFNYRSEGDYTLKLTLNGSNPGFYDGYPINMTLSIAGKLPGIFKSALFSGDFNKHILESVGTGTTPP